MTVSPVGRLQQYVKVPRLHVFVRERGGWLPVNVAGTAWDAHNARTIYKALGYCTLWIKDAA